MPTSTIDNIVAKFQNRILRNERRAASEMVRVYVEGWKRIKSQLDKLQGEYTESIKRGEDVSLNWIYQNSRLADLQELIARELGKFGKIAGDKITQEQRRAIEESLEFSRDAMILRLGPEYDVPGGLRVRSLNIAAIEQMVGVNQPGSPLWKLLESISAQGAQKASDALIEGMVLGYNPRKIAPMVRDALGVQLNRALTISRTEVMRAHRAATDANYNANADVVKGWRWQAALTGNTCPVCISMHGREFPLSEKMTSHPNCFPAGTMVSGPNPIAGTKRYYTGELVSIRTASGVELSFTPNHPILTRHGWIAGGLLQKGNYVIRSTGRKNAKPAIDIDYNDMPTLIEKVVESFDMVLVEMPTAPEDFHGDGIGSQVYVVFTNSLLGNNLNTALNKPLFKHKFSLRSISLGSFFRFSTIAKLFPSMFHTSHSSMSSRRIGLPFFGRFFTCFKQVGNGVTANSNASSNKSSSNHCTRNIISFGKGIFGFSSKIPFNNNSRWQWIMNIMKGTKFFAHNSSSFSTISQLDSTLNKSRFNSVNRDMKIPSEILKAFPIEVELDEIVKINRSVFSGHVYNLQTKDEWYIANSIITHNCRCVAQPLTYSWEELGERFGVDWSRVEDAGPSFEEIAKKYGISPERIKTYRDRQMTGEAYFNTLKPDKQRALLGPTRYNAWKDGAVDFEALSKQTFSLEWGAGKALTPLTELLTPEQIVLYKK